MLDAERISGFLARRWIWIFGVVFGLYVGLPFLAPLLYHLGWAGAGLLIQRIYSTQCHQLPDRSFFLFGSKVMYTMPEVQAAWQNTSDPAILRQFVGNVQMGWKVAWSDRMVSMYTSMFVFGLLWWPLRRKLRPLPFWGLLLLWLPMALDGTSHMLSDILGGLENGFRYNNAWLAVLTGRLLPASFYVGNALGSFNSWMRLITGVLFGLGTIGYIFPMLDASLRLSAPQGRPLSERPLSERPLSERPLPQPPASASTEWKSTHSNPRQ